MIDQTQIYALRFLLGHQCKPMTPKEHAYELAHVLVPNKPNDRQPYFQHAARQVITHLILSLTNKTGAMPTIEDIDRGLRDKKMLLEIITDPVVRQCLENPDVLMTAISCMMPISSFLRAEQIREVKP